MRTIPDKAEISIDFPDKAYMGAFGPRAGYAAEADDEGVVLKLERSGDDRRVASMHLHYYLLAGILEELAGSIKGRPRIDEPHREALMDAADAFRRSLGRRRPKSSTTSGEAARPHGWRSRP